MRSPCTTITTTGMGMALALALTLSQPGAGAGAATPPPANSTFSNNVIFTAPPGLTIVYPRLVELSDGRLLATASWLSPAGQKPVFPIFASDDGAATWTWIANLTDQANGLGMSAQPALAELPFAVGPWPPGTVLASGNSWGPNSTNIDVYASTDRGATWRFVSNVARGGAPSTANGAPTVWEPFIVCDNQTVGVFYSDQRDPRYGQKLAHQESTDLTTWGPVINDVTAPSYAGRPGMPVITEVPPLAQWLLVHEYPGAVGAGRQTVDYPVYYHLAASPFAFRFADGMPIVAGGKQADASPYAVWTVAGNGSNGNGTIVVSDADNSAVFVNQALGAPDQWLEVPTVQPSSYSRALHVFRKDPDRLLILGAAEYGQLGQDVPTSMSCSVVSIAALTGRGRRKARAMSGEEECERERERESKVQRKKFMTE